MKLRLILFTIILSCTVLWGQGLTTSGKKIVDENGDEVILKGMGLGGWMLMEGYMMQSSDVADTQHEFRERLIELFGETKTDEFFQAWLDNHVTKADIDSLATWGYNSVRLPMHYNLFTLPIEDEPVQGENTWLTKGFEMVDELLDWCEANQMYLILDLHAAPGGQGANAAISDYDPDKPSLWESDENKSKTVALWQKLAERYVDEPWMGGYDLINEVNWNLPGGTALRELYENITTAIRTVDQNHIIFIEGNWFANDFTGLTPPWDDNMVYSFHKYWSYNDPGSIQWVLDIREQHNVPLWMGESGENSNVWFTDAVSLFEQNGIGWSWWPMKRIETIVGPYGIEFTDGYRNILEYWRGNVEKPSEEVAYAAMMDLANKTNSQNCTFQKDVYDAKIRQPHTDETIPYTQHQIPGIIHMSDYDLGKNNFAYYDVDTANYQLNTNSFQAWNSGWVYRNDGVDIESNTDTMNSNGFHVGFINKGEWMNYTVNVTESGIYSMDVRVASNDSGGQYHFDLNNEAITDIQTISATGGWTNFITQQITDVILEAGTHTLTFRADSATSYNMSSVVFTKTGEIDSASFSVLNAGTGATNNEIEVVLNQSVNGTTLTGSEADFTLLVNGEVKTISEVQLQANAERKLTLNFDTDLIHSDVVQLSYNGTGIQTNAGKSLSTFTELPVNNTIPQIFEIPGKIEAENYFETFGIQTETTTDEGGGLNLSYTSTDDYADYRINVTRDLEYDIRLRVAAESRAGRVTFYEVADSGDETALTTIDFPVTGGWQIWEDTLGKIPLTQGLQTLRMKVVTGDFNLNWIQIELPDTDQDGIIDELDDCPNSPEGTIIDENGCAIPTIGINNFTIRVESETCRANDNGGIFVTAATTDDYTASLTGNGTVSKEFTNTTDFTGLPAGSYTLCFTLTNYPQLQQCFTVAVEQPMDLAVSSTIDTNEQTITLDLNGASRYFIELNEKTYVTEESSITLPLGKDINSLTVKTDEECQGIHKETMAFNKEPLVHPNPLTGDYIYITIGDTERNPIEMVLYDLSGNIIHQEVRKGSSQIDIKSLPKGLYILKLIKDNKTYNYKLIK